MRYNPVISIILGAVLIIVLFFSFVIIIGSNFNNGVVSTVFLIIGTLILLGGGFIATYFAKDRKIRYGIYVGIIFAVLEITAVISHGLVGYSGIFIVIFIFVLFLLLTGIGGFVAKMTERSNRQLFKEKHLSNGFSPILAVAVGLVVAYIIAILLELITGTYLTHITSFGIVDFIIGATSVVIGAFVTTFLSKEKKIQYGIYLGIIMITISLLNKLYLSSIHYPHFHENYLIFIGVIVGYLLSAVVGSYIGVIVVKRLKGDTTKK
jgi:hypothetical protein